MQQTVSKHKVSVEFARPESPSEQWFCSTLFPTDRKLQEITKGCLVNHTRSSFQFRGVAPLSYVRKNGPEVLGEGLGKWTGWPRNSSAEVPSVLWGTVYCFVRKHQNATSEKLINSVFFFMFTV